MNWLLKIVEGPMKGAEIALVGGMRLKVGRDEQCDIVLADATLADVAFDLDVSDEAVTVIDLDGSARALPPFEVRAFGTTAIAVGPSDGDWQELTYPRPDVPEEKPAAAEPQEEAKDGAASAAEEEAKPAEEPSVAEEPKSADEESKPAEESAKRRRSRGCAIGCLVLLVLLAVLAAVLWWLWPQVGEKVVEYWQMGKERVFGSETAKPKTAPAVPEAKPAEKLPLTLEALAKAHGLALSETNGVPLISGNLKKRTERLAIRALALAQDRRTAFDLTDDETLRASAEALLFTLSEGALKVITVTNRVVEIGGAAPDLGVLDRTLRALAADMPGLRLSPVRQIKVGRGGTVAPTAVDAVRDRTAVQPSGTPPGAAPSVSSVAESGAIQPDFPVAGILTVPYPCVVLRNGMRCVEGAQVGGFVLERIEPDKLTFRDGERKVEWKP